MKGNERAILLIGLAVWIAGLFVHGPHSWWPNQVRRTIGIFMATALLLLVNTRLPKVALGLALIMAITIIGGEAEQIADTADTALGPPNRIYFRRSYGGAIIP